MNLAELSNQTSAMQHTAVELSIPRSQSSSCRGRAGVAFNPGRQMVLEGNEREVGVHTAGGVSIVKRFRPRNQASVKIRQMFTSNFSLFSDDEWVASGPWSMERALS